MYAQNQILQSKIYGHFKKTNAFILPLIQSHFKGQVFSEFHKAKFHFFRVPVGSNQSAYWKIYLALHPSEAYLQSHLHTLAQYCLILSMVSAGLKKMFEVFEPYVLSLNAVRLI